MKINVINKHPIAQADPYIIEENNEFYIFTSAQAEQKGVHCYKSKELLGNYEYLGLAFSLEGHKEYWAPSVIKIDNEFYMYVSIMKEDEEDVHLQTMMVAKSNKIEGPYKLVNKLIEPFSIDSHPVINKMGQYLFYSVNDYDADKAGTRIVIDKMVSPTSMKGEPKVVVYPSIEQEIFMKDRFKKGQDWYTIEGACYFYEDGYHYLLYSANCYQNEYYFVGYCVAKTDEQDLTKVEFKKYPDDNTYKPLLSMNEFEGGTGHNTVIKHKGQWYIVYHGRELEGNEVPYDNRTMRIAKLNVNKGVLTVERSK